MRFKYSARNQSGSNVKGVVEASNIKSAAKLLIDKKLTPITLSEDRPVFNIMSLINKFGSVSTSDVANFTRQLSTMITAGLPLTDSLSLLKVRGKFV